MLSRVGALLTSGLGRARVPRQPARNCSEKGKDQALKFEIGGKKETFKVVDTQVEANKAYGFFSTLKGQKLVGGMWVVGSALGALYQIAPHWFFLSKVKDIYQSYSKGFPTLIKEEMLNLINEVTVDMKLREDQVKSVKLFVLTLTEPHAWGELGRDALVGFPEFYYWEDRSEVPIEQMRFGAVLDTGADCNLSQTQIDSDAAKLFCSSMILSPDAKKFSIAREIQRTIIQPYMTQGIFSFVFILLTYNTSRIINKKLGLFKRPPLIRGIAYLGLLPTMFLSYVVVKDAFNRKIDREVDKRASQISPEYAAGGVEYYEKVMQRNIALRELEGEGGRSRYTGKGDVVQGIVRVKQASLQDRRDICASYL